MNYYGQHLSYTFVDETLEHASKMLKVFDTGAKASFHDEFAKADKNARFIIRFHDSGIYDKVKQEYAVLCMAIFIETTLNYREVDKLMFYGGLRGCRCDFGDVSSLEYFVKDLRSQEIVKHYFNKKTKRLSIQYRPFGNNDNMKKKLNDKLVIICQTPVSIS